MDRAEYQSGTSGKKAKSKTKNTYSFVHKLYGSRNILITITVVRYLTLVCVRVRTLSLPFVSEKSVIVFSFLSLWILIMIIFATFPFSITSLLFFRFFVLEKTVACLSVCFFLRNVLIFLRTHFCFENEWRKQQERADCTHTKPNTFFYRQRHSTIFSIIFFCRCCSLGTIFSFHFTSSSNRFLWFIKPDDACSALLLLLLSCVCECDLCFYHLLIWIHVIQYTFRSDRLVNNSNARSKNFSANDEGDDDDDVDDDGVWKLRLRSVNEKAFPSLMWETVKVCY